MKYPECPACGATFPVILTVDVSGDLKDYDAVTLHVECYQCHVHVDQTITFREDGKKAEVVS